MPPHLHPRSRLTSSLFATTLLASFLVVGLPHLIPCPAPRIVYADGEMSNDGSQRKRRRRKPAAEASKGSLSDAPVPVTPEVAKDDVPDDTPDSKGPRRECPVPKPNGRMGQLLGFKSEITDGQNRDRRKPS